MTANRHKADLAIVLSDVRFRWVKWTSFKLSETSADRQQRESTRTKTHQFGAICTTPGNLCLYRTAWWGSGDSNFRPNDYQPLALSLSNGPVLWVFARTAAK